MQNKYGGVNNSQAFDDVQEACVIGEPKPMPKPVEKRSFSSMLVGWIVFTIASFIIVTLLTIITGLSELLIAKKVPLFVSLSIPLIPSVIYLIYMLNKKHTN